MGISMLTTIRRTDICELHFVKYLNGDYLRKAINKSEAQRDSLAASHLSFNLKTHQQTGIVIMPRQGTLSQKLPLPLYTEPYSQATSYGKN